MSVASRLRAPAGPAVPARPIARPAGAAGDAYRWQVLAVVVVGSFMSALSTTMINLAITDLQNVFGAALSTVEWVVTGYLLALAVSVPGVGWLANRAGIKRVYLAALGLFVVASFLCGLAPSIGALIAVRIAQGVGGAALQPLGQALLFQAWPPEKRGTATAFYGLPVLVAPAIGPTLGGYVVQYLDWRIIFFVNVPVGLLGLALGLRLLRERRAAAVTPFDVPGFLLSAPGLALLLYGFSVAATDGWGSGAVRATLALGVALLAAFVARELTARHPLLDLRLYTRRVFVAASVVSWVTYIALIAGSFLLPVYLQQLRGLTPLDAGLLLLPQGLALAVALPVAGRLYDRIGPRPVVAFGLVLLGAATFLLARLDTTTPYDAIRTILLVRGFGIGFAFIPLITAALSVAHGDELPRASALFSVMQQVSGSFGVAVLSTLLAQEATVHTAHLAEGATPGSALGGLLQAVAAGFQGQGMAANQAQGAALSEVYGLIERQASALSFQDVFFLAGVIVVPAVLLALLLPGRRPRPRPTP